MVRGTVQTTWARPGSLSPERCLIAGRAGNGEACQTTDTRSKNALAPVLHDTFTLVDVFFFFFSRASPVARTFVDPPACPRTALRACVARAGDPRPLCATSGAAVERLKGGTLTPLGPDLFAR